MKPLARKTTRRVDGEAKRKLPKNVKVWQFQLTPRTLIWSVVIFFLGLLVMSSLRFGSIEEEVSLSQVLVDIKENKVVWVEVLGDLLRVEYRDPKVYKLSRKEATESFTDLLVDAGIDPTKVGYITKDQTFLQIMAELVPTILLTVALGVFFLFLLRQARGAQDGIFSFGKSRARLFAKGKQNITFKDVGGVKEAKQELEEVVDFLKHPRKYHKLGARTPKGVLLIGPSGTGKTLLARAVAGEAGVPFFSMAGSEFMEMLVGVGASRVRDLFRTAKKAAPSVIFIDEIDAIGRMRGGGFAGGGHGEQEQTLNQILVEMDGFAPNDNVMVLAATNRPELLDPALVRPGRFDRRVTLELPDLEEREKILKIHVQGKPVVTSGPGAINWQRLAKRTVGFSGADIENMMNEAAIQAARENKKEVEEEHLEEAATKVKLGPERKRLQSDLEREMTAYHEAGHAVVGHMLLNTDPVHRVSIVARGMSLGATQMVPDRDKYQYTRTELIEKIAVLLGGRAAEELVFGELTGGAASDILQVTRIAKRMVTDLGMSEIGPLSLGPMWEDADWGRSFGAEHISPQTQAAVDGEVKKLVDNAYEVAVNLLKKHRVKLNKIAKALMDTETIDGEEFVRLMGVKKAQPKKN